MPASGAELVARWNDELLNLGFRPPTQSRQLAPTAVGRLRRDVAVDLILTRLGSKRSAWNAANVRGEAEKLIASVGIIVDRAARVELAEDSPHVRWANAEHCGNAPTCPTTSGISLPTASSLSRQS